LIAGLLVSLLSFSGTVWGFSPYRPDTWREIGSNYTIRVNGIHYSEIFLKIDILRVKGGHDQPPLLIVPYCMTPEYQENSKSVFLRMKQPPPKLAAIYADFEERQNAFEKEYRAEYEKRWQEIGPRVLESTGYEKLNDSMKPFNDRRESFWKELGRIQEAALPEMQRQDWSYYIIDKAAETVSGPLSEKAFLASKAVDGKIIHWKPAPRTFEEYSRGMTAIAIVIGCVLCFPWFVLLLVIIGVVYFFYKKRKNRLLLKYFSQQRPGT